MSYRKRDIGHWNQGKRYKGWRKAKEKEYASKEIDTQIAEQDPEFRYRHYSHTKNEVERLRGKIQHYEQLHETYKRDEGLPWTSYWMRCVRDTRKKLEKKLKELKNGRSTRPQQKD